MELVGILRLPQGECEEEGSRGGGGKDEHGCQDGVRIGA